MNITFFIQEQKDMEQEEAEMTGYNDETSGLVKALLRA